MGTSSAWRFRWLTTNHLWIEDFPAQNYSIHPSINNSRDLNCRHKAKVKGLTCWVEAHHYFLSGWKFTQQAVNISYLFMISGIDWSFNCKLPAKNGDEHQHYGFKLPKSGDSWGTAEPPCKKNTYVCCSLCGCSAIEVSVPIQTHDKKKQRQARTIL